MLVLANVRSDNINTYSFIDY